MKRLLRIRRHGIFLSSNLIAVRNCEIHRFWICLLYTSCTVLLGVVQSSAALVLSGQLIALYNEDPAVIAAGVHRLWTVASVYTLWGIADVLMGGIRGYGRSVAPMVINLLGTCGVDVYKRQV